MEVETTARSRVKETRQFASPNVSSFRSIRTSCALSLNYCTTRIFERDDSRVEADPIREKFIDFFFFNIIIAKRSRDTKRNSHS